MITFKRSIMPCNFIALVSITKIYSKVKKEKRIRKLYAWKYLGPQFTFGNYSKKKQKLTIIVIRILRELSSFWLPIILSYHCYKISVLLKFKRKQTLSFNYNHQPSLGIEAQLGESLTKCRKFLCKFILQNGSQNIIETWLSNEDGHVTMRWTAAFWIS